MSDEPSVDFLKEKYNLAPESSSAEKPRRLARTFGAFLVVTAVIGIGFSYKVAETSVDQADGDGGFSFFSGFRQLVSSDDKDLPGEEDDRINVLLMGVGGSGHAGPELSDTIIFASFRPSTGEIGMLSIPRDTVVPIEGYGYRKINHVNAYAEAAEKGSGLEAASQAVGSILGQEIHYAMKADFAGFEELIDAVGGVEVHVDRSFTDYSYPTWDDLYQTVSFKEGWQHMDGDTALKYARSRHGNNGEGNDFARAQRQQKIILAVKDKLLSTSTLFNPAKINKLIGTFQENVKTDMSIWEMTRMAKYIPDIHAENINNYVLDTSPDSPLYETNINGAYVILPKQDDWSEVQYIAEHIFESGSVASASPQISEMPARIEIQNGTHVSGLASQASQLLASSGFNIKKIGNAESRGYQRTIIYDLTEGKKSEELELLKEYLEADLAGGASGWVYSEEVEPRELTVTNPGEEYVTATDPIDFLIILGENASFLVLQ